MLSHETAAELSGLVDGPSPMVHVTVPADRRVSRIPGAVVHLSARAAAARHPTRLPPRTRVEETVLEGGRWYDDVHYRGHRVRVELDGRVAHPDPSRFRDLRRDNAAAAGGDTVLRCGWRDVTGQPCACAVQVATVLHRHGWTGTPHPCRPGCVITEGLAGPNRRNPS